MKQTSDIKTRDYLIYVIIAVLVIIIITIAGTYAYFKADVTLPSKLGNVDAALECISIDYKEAYNDTDLVEGEILKLNYNYPIKDEFAIANVVPVTITVSNTCTDNINDLDYTLAITSLSNAEGYISDNQIRVAVKKQSGTEPETTLISNNYLSNLNQITTGNAYTYLLEDLNNREAISAYENKISYVVDSNTISNQTTNIYKVYLWVDYYEGDYKMYDTTNYPDYEHEETYDNTTEEKKFAAAISLVVNP